MLIDPYQFQSVKIVQVVREAKDAVSVQLEKPTHYTYQCGQHAIVRISMPDGTKLVRQYSFSSAPSAGELWLTVSKMPDGAVSGWFNDDAKVGDVVEISRPFSGPLVQKYPRGVICMIAGGSGIAPVMSHLRNIRTLTHKPQTHLLYSARTSNLCFEKELIPMSHEHITICRSDIRGRVNEQDITLAAKDPDCIFICGSRSFVQDTSAMCRKIAPEATIFSEAFTL